MRSLTQRILLPVPVILLAGVSILIALPLSLMLRNPLVLAGGLTLAGALVLALHPKWLWFLLIGLLPFSMEVRDILGAGNHLTLPTEALAPLTGVSVALAVLRTGKLRWTVSPLHAAAGLLLLIQYSSFLHSEIPLVTAKALARGTVAFFGGYVLTQMAVSSLREVGRLCLVFAATTSFVVCYGFYTQVRTGFQIYQEIAAPFFNDHCVYAAYLCFPAAFALGALTQPLKRKSLIVGFLGLVSIGILATFVRGAWIGMVALVFYLLLRQRTALSFRFAFFLSVLALLGIFAAVYLGLEPLLRERWRTLFDIRYVANESRIDRWMAALSMWLTQPTLGVGLGCYPDLYYQHIYYVHSFEGKLHMGAHNLYLEILAELGVVGLFAFCLLILSFFIETRRVFRLAEGRPAIRALSLGLEGMMVVYLTHALFNNLGPSDKIDIAFWTTCGLASSVRCFLQKQTTKLPSGEIT
jgi:O-antigen ligase